MVGIYKITNKINDKAYIGQSIHIQKRWSNHRSDAFDPKSACYDYPLYKAIRKYGIDNFAFEVLEECLRSELNEKETQYIINLHTHVPNGYNQDYGGNNASHYNKLSDDLVAQIILTLKTSNENSDNIGLKFGVSGSTIRKINTGESCFVDGETYPIRKPLWTTDANHRFCNVCGDLLVDKNAQHCVKCAQVAQRRVERPSSLELAKMIKENGFVSTGKYFGVSDNAIKNWCKQYGIPHKLSQLIVWYDQQTKRDTKESADDQLIYSQKPVEQIDPETGKIIAVHSSVNSAARAMGRKTGNRISATCRGEQTTAYGYLWRFASTTSHTQPSSQST